MAKKLASTVEVNKWNWVFSLNSIVELLNSVVVTSIVNIPEGILLKADVHFAVMQQVFQYLT